MWAGLGYYRRARFLLEVSCARNGLMEKGQGRAYRKVGACLATLAAVRIRCSMFCLTESGRLVQSSYFLE
jgi:hypothetical protein